MAHPPVGSKGAKCFPSHQVRDTAWEMPQLCLHGKKLHCFEQKEIQTYHN